MFYDKFIKLCIDRGVSPSVVAVEIGLNKSAATAWKKGSIPTAVTLAKLAEYFGVSVDYFSDEQEKQPTQKDELSDDVLSADEWKLIAAYRDLNEQGKQELHKYAALLRGAGIYKNDSQSRLVAGE